MGTTLIKSIVIVGGGTAGWMSACALVKSFGRAYSIRLVESEEIGIVGVGEATIPHLSFFNKTLEIDEAEFVRQTQGTFKLGIQFKDWGRLGDTYIHGFGALGHELGSVPFHQYWLRARHARHADELGTYSLNTLAAPRGKFMVSPSDAPGNTPLANIAYAYHFDAGLYARYLRRYAEALGVVRTEGKVREVRLRPEDGYVESVVLQSGEVVAGELFIDCSGFRGLLIEGALHTGYEDWTHWLPCDSALAVPCENVGPPTPYTRSTARSAGWQWRIPLQHRTGNGHVYSSKFISDDEAASILLKNLDGKALAEPRQLRFTTGRRRKIWNKNVLAVGLSGGFMEPLESTSIYMIQSAIGRLVLMFPTEGITPVIVDRYNEIATFESERIRDFLILHYCATERDDSPFWNYCRTMPIPEPLRDTIALFRDGGRFFRRGEELFGQVSWVQVMIGQRILPQRWHPMVDQMSDADLRAFVDHVKSVVAGCVEAMPMHQQFIDRHCKAAGT
ncbi:MAG: tryptophan halogenase family protein [Steroidobacteraceae bacterium]